MCNDELSQLKNYDSPIWRTVAYTYNRHFVLWAVFKFEADPDDAEDAYENAVEVLIKGVHYGSLTKFDKDLRTYLFCIGVRQLINIFRKTLRIDNLCRALSYLNEQEEDCLSFLDDGEDPLLFALNKCLNELPPGEKEFILLCFDDKKLSMEKIAGMTGLGSEEYASLKKFRLLKKLEKMMNDLGFYDLSE
jgi:DNA-directed RNA polymerase specialized sigma24 family protein